ncbi:MAG: hypothetical protein KatS3mg099_257 [Candidatus Parcubacteria bacterium]|nr:MAG: hypothetical protein KatS3mg099_257 [Candidatus Parcubacteria bacterium]
MSQKRVIAAFDPGYDRLGVAVLTGDVHSPTLLFARTLRTERSLEHDARLYSIGKQVAHILAEYQPSLCALETLFFQVNRKTALAVAEARGIIRYEIARAGVPLVELSPQAVKIAATSDGRASKEAVERMVRRLVRVDNNAQLGDDAIDAIALAIAALAHAPRLQQ